MTVPTWDAQRFHEQRTTANPRPTRKTPARTKGIVTLVVVTLCLGAAAVSANQPWEAEPDPLGVCHATGSTENPFVFLVVDEDGYEHAHHRHHDGDFFVSAGAEDCDGDDFGAPDAGNETAEPGNETEEDEGTGASGGVGSGSDPEPTPEPEPEPAPEPADNGTEAPEETAGPTDPVQNETTDPGNGTEAPGEPDNGTAAPESAENATQEPLPGDAAVTQSAIQDDVEVVLTLVVSSVGEGDAVNVSLSDALPDVRRTWMLSGADAESCVLDGNDLSCWFGDLASGESRTITLQAYTDRMPCGFPLTNTAYAWSDGDAEARNDASSAGIAARAC